MSAEVPKVDLLANSAIGQMLNTRSLFRRHCWFPALMIPLLISGLIFFQAAPSYAASGGRIGGGNFRAPSMPRGGSYGGGGYRGGYGGGYRSGYRGGGIGFPFILPIFGFGGGGLFGFLILMSIAGVLVNSIRGGNTPSIDRSTGLSERSQGPITMLQLQIGLLANAKVLQQELRRLAGTSDTKTSVGLQKVLQETTLALLRNPNLWVYANLESGEVPFSSAEATFNRLSLTERSKLSAELTSNFAGQLLSENTSTIKAGEASETNEYIAVTLLIASSSRINLNKSISSEQIKESLRILGAIPSNELIALEVIWQPEGEGDVLSSEELVTTYPNLKHL